MNKKEEVCTTHIMQDADAGKRLHKLKRRRTRERGNITLFVTDVGKFRDTTTLKITNIVKVDSMIAWVN